MVLNCGVNMVLLALLYIILLVLGFLWLVAWISMPFKLDKVNRNLEDIKELMRGQSERKKSTKKNPGQ